jgi:hypothetical protein
MAKKGRGIRSSERRWTISSPLNPISQKRGGVFVLKVITRRPGMRKFFSFLALVFLLLTLSCSGGGGGGSSSGGGSGVNSTPAISNLSYYPNQTTLNQGGGAVSVTYTFNYIDNGGDLSTLTLFYYDSSGNLVLNNPVTIQGVSGKTSGTIQGTVIFPTTARFTWTGGGYVTDAGGRQSNRLTATFTVY